jgi:ribonuclease G
MAKNTLVINFDLRETRVALIEDGIIAELHVERASTRGTLGNIVLGKVTRVLPGMQAAFIDVGLERAAFLHVEDLIRPDDFEAFLSGAKREEDDLYEPQEDGGHPPETASPATPDGVTLPQEASSAPAAAVAPEPPTDATSEDAAVPEGPDPAGDEGLDESDDDGEELDGEELEGEEPGVEEPGVEEPGVEQINGNAEASDAPPTGTEPSAEPIAAAPVVPPVLARQADRPAANQRGGGGPDRGSRTKHVGRHGRGRGRQQPAHGKQHGNHRDTSRISRSTPIRDVIREGQEIIVQVSKEPIGSKGARVTSHVSLPGRYVVYMPTIDQIGISKRIGSDKERARLREAIESIKPPTGGLIVRTVAEGLTKKQLKADVGYLVRLWGDVAKKRDGVKSPNLLYQELDLVLKTARDSFNDDIEQIVIDDREQYQRLARFVEMFMPERVKDIVLYTGDEPIFDAYGIEDEIGRALSRKVPLPSGGYLIIDEAEALTAIDVNTGRYVGKGSKDLEDTLFKTNLEAVEEIAYQLRFRNLGGLIVLDLIDMERASNREKIRRRLEDLLQKDKAKTTLNRISDLGLIEMTRKRTRESLGRSLHEPCFYCDGTGQLQAKQTIVYEILRQLRRDRAYLPGYSVIVNAHPAIIDLMKGEEREAVQEAERRFMRRIELAARKEYHLEQFDLAGK